ncbi:uncharacterized protein MONOS_17031 [Monocercomonoides exilis]|uniref:uncharacterized protein n=1 Tax=Monocercomonoides exilis TaxID=2049356 RepID=UPI00355A012C|nr:hypothetical protein MONOS_17031 [Monocercomonoides exilis]
MNKQKKAIQKKVTTVQFSTYVFHPDTMVQNIEEEIEDDAEDSESVDPEDYTDQGWDRYIESKRRALLEQKTKEDQYKEINEKEIIKNPEIKACPQEKSDSLKDQIIENAVSSLVSSSFASTLTNSSKTDQLFESNTYENKSLHQKLNLAPSYIGTNTDKDVFIEKTNASSEIKTDSALIRKFESQEEKSDVITLNSSNKENEVQNIELCEVSESESLSDSLNEEDDEYDDEGWDRYIMKKKNENEKRCNLENEKTS